MSDLHTDQLDGEDLTAGEYALGVLDQGARQAAETRMQADTGFAREVEAWQARLYPLAEAIAPVPAPPQVWPRIARALPAAPVAAASKVVELNSRRAVRFWRSWALAATAAAAVALVFLAVRLPSPIPAPVAPVATPAPAPPVLVAELSSPKGGDKGLLSVAYDPARGALYAIPNGLSVPDRRAAELWLIPADGVPRSLGVIDAEHPTTVKVSDVLKPGALPTATLAITIEQPGGSPTGKPTTTPKWVGKLATA